MTTVHHQADRIRALTNDTFNTLVLQGSGPIVVEVMSYGCAHCRVIEPVLQDVAEAVKATETIFRLNIAVERELADSYDVHSTPTLAMFLNGTEVGRTVGTRSHLHPTSSRHSTPVAVLNQRARSSAHSIG